MTETIIPEVVEKPKSKIQEIMDAAKADKGLSFGERVVNQRDRGLQLVYPGVYGFHRKIFHLKDKLDSVKTSLLNRVFEPK